MIRFNIYCKTRKYIHFFQNIHFLKYPIFQNIHFIKYL